MPANLPPQYFEAEKNFRTAKGSLEKIAALEEMLAIMPKHKGTDHLRAELRTRIAKLTQSLDKRTATQRASMMIEKVGAAQVAIVGLPNAGKSQLVASLTKATPTVAAYPFTTHSATPGMMAFENIQIQLIDTPPLSEQPPEWWLLNIIRRADGLLLVVDLSDDPVFQLGAVIARLEERKLGLGEDKGGGDEEFPLRYKKTLVAGNKMDFDKGGEGFQALHNKYGSQLPMAAVSALGPGLKELRLRIFRMMDIIRVYTKMPGDKPDLTDPIILPRGSNLGDAAASVHKDFAARMKFARIWGSGKHDGIMAKRDHILQDGDVIELHM
ncbi:GTPase [Chloroflexota bacterium]